MKRNNVNMAMSYQVSLLKHQLEMKDLQEEVNESREDMKKLEDEISELMAENEQLNWMVEKEKEKRVRMDNRRLIMERKARKYERYYKEERADNESLREKMKKMSDILRHSERIDEKNSYYEYLDRINPYARDEWDENPEEGIFYDIDPSDLPY